MVLGGLEHGNRTTAGRSTTMDRLAPRGAGVEHPEGCHVRVA